MNINQALKLKNQLTGKLNKLTGRMTSNNRWIQGNKPTYDVKKVSEEHAVVLRQLIDLKIELNQASAPIIGDIIRIAELKSYISTLRSLPCKAGIETSYGNSNPITYEVAISEVERDSLIEKVEAEIASIQDKIDVYNATTEI